MTQTAEQSRGSDTTTAGIRITVSPRFMPDHSKPEEGLFLFAYHVRITNERDTPVRLLSRRWLIIDANGEQKIVAGEGVIGLQPTIPPTGSHEYESFVPLTTPWGTMEGTYTFTTEHAEDFDADIARFFLITPEAANAQTEPAQA